VQLLEVELELLALKNVAISTAALARAGGEASEQTASLELVSHKLVNHAVGSVLGALVLDVAGDLGGGIIGLLLAELSASTTETSPGALRPSRASLASSMLCTTLPTTSWCAPRPW